MSDRHEQLNQEAATLRGIRFTRALATIASGKLDESGGAAAPLTETEKADAAAWACLNRRERRRRGIRGRTPR